MTDTQHRLLEDVRAADANMSTVHAQALANVARVTAEARQARAAAIRAADDAGIDRALIAEAAGLTWPMSRQRWSQLRNG